MENNEKILDLVGKLVGQFLADNGGYSNKYYTYVKGKITPNKLGGITEIMTPGIFKANKIEIDTLCSELERQIKKLKYLLKWIKMVVIYNMSQSVIPN